MAQPPTLPGTLYISVDLELLNGTAQPAPLSAPLFTLETQGGLEYFGGAETAFHPRGCPQNASVSKDDSTRCVVVFSVPASALAIGVRYLSLDGRQAKAVVHAEPCMACGKDCIDLKGEDSENCDGCQRKVGLGHCEAGTPICDTGATLCGSTCVNLKSDPENCGECYARVSEEMTCINGERRCHSAYKKACGNSCVDPINDQHCGTCDRSCGAEGYCSAFCADANCYSYVDYHCKMVADQPAVCTALCGKLQCKQTEIIFFVRTTVTSAVKATVAFHHQPRPKIPTMVKPAPSKAKNASASEAWLCPARALGGYFGIVPDVT